MPRSLIRLLALVAIAGLVLSACGNDDSDTDPPDLTEPPETAPPETTAPPGNDDGNDGDDPEPPTETTTPGVLPVPGMPDYDDVAAASDACEVLEVLEALVASLDARFDDLDGRGVAAGLEYIGAIHRRGAELAPAEVAEDFSYISESLDELVAFMALHDYDLDTVERIEQEDPETWNELSFAGDAFSDADANINSWAEAEC